MRAVLASHNKKKMKEMREILSQLGVEVVSQADVGVDLEPEETGTTFEENARIKAAAIMEATGLPAIADDSGLVVDALDGAPGVYSARYGGEGLDDTDRWKLLLKNMEGKTDRACRFVSVICCVLPNGEEVMSRGEAVKGQSLFTIMATVSGIAASFFGGFILDHGGARMLTGVSTLAAAIGTVILFLTVDRIIEKKKRGTQL